MRIERGQVAVTRNLGRMPVGLSAVSVSRVAAGVFAALWAMTGLANDYVALAAIGPSAAVLGDLCANVLLAVGASLALVDAGGWRRIFIVALVVVTIDRIAEAVGSGAAAQQIIGALIACAAIGAIAFTGLSSSTRS
jgi:hypothetical protein